MEKTKTKTTKYLPTTNYQLSTNKGFTLINILIASFIFLVVFLGVVEALKVSINLTAHNKARVGALALTNERMEFIRSLSFANIGTQGGLPAGDIPQQETIVLNGITYLREIIIDNVDAPEDGLGVDDENSIPADYKRMKVKTSWTIQGTTKTVSLVSDVVPPGIETNDGGGSIVMNVFNQIGEAVTNAEITIVNPSIIPPVSITRTMNDNGVFLLSGPAAGNYQVSVTKTGYSTSSTYGTTTEIVTPTPEHFLILEGNVKSKSFQIDKVSSKTIQSYTFATANTWVDFFDHTDKLWVTATTTIESGALVLQDDDGSYYPSGYAQSVSVSHPKLYEWQEFQWNHATSSETVIIYQVLYNTGSDWAPIPSADLPNNETGFSISPINLSSLDIATYNEIRLLTTLTTTDASSTPEVYDWSVSYLASPVLPNFDFNMRGNGNNDDITKIMGQDAVGNPVYKYNEDLQTNSSGEIALYNLEWDDYLITNSTSTTGLAIAISCPPQPLELSPDARATTSLYMTPYTDEALVVAVRNVGGVLLDGAEVRLYRTGYDETKKTYCGQSFFPNLSKTTYSVDVSLDGYTPQTLNNIAVDGPSSATTVVLN
ncbi:prepilin-type N-terminal cleavage/methylation domain-containing protein [Patescibacteria group bacterium]|nr:prepilin-type N-terminal cleavage/methylation domain-containing protein [Patescibacteria group bacterium]MBU1519448.1 prepilin-type N-terminal cleavage/methylation domain-containing protein [Patescibacteria group bacterium]MBU2416995.1 prepilin-type N-terminal cleavage/methylation domain-containing protein [Patescibacteria group bacterium]MBU2460869.1 prepilin-type N-terminal cleavage/methylation domain-containing protein [Patescibacteria group bacterium]